MDSIFEDECHLKNVDVSLVQWIDNETEELLAILCCFYFLRYIFIT